MRGQARRRSAFPASARRSAAGRSAGLARISAASSPEPALVTSKPASASASAMISRMSGSSSTSSTRACAKITPDRPTAPPTARRPGPVTRAPAQTPANTSCRGTNRHPRRDAPALHRAAADGVSVACIPHPIRTRTRPLRVAPRHAGARRRAILAAHAVHHGGRADRHECGLHHAEPGGAAVPARSRRARRRRRSMSGPGILTSVTPLRRGLRLAALGPRGGPARAQADGAALLLRHRGLHRADEPGAECLAVLRASAR